jgi:putative transposase
MCYSVDLREKVVKYLENGGSVSQASQIFNIGRFTIYRWLNRQNLAATKVTNRQRKIIANLIKNELFCRLKLI